MPRSQHPRYTDTEAVAAVGLKCKVFDIGDWNMNDIETCQVAHEITGRILYVNVLIRDDADANFYPIQTAKGITGWEPGGRVAADATNISMKRNLGDLFDSTDFEATSYNRGWITVWYAP